jgi:hypothetical protein
MAPIRSQHHPRREVERLSIETNHGIGQNAKANFPFDAESLAVTSEVAGAVGDKVTFPKRRGDGLSRSRDERSIVGRWGAELTEGDRRQPDRGGG